VDTLQPRSSNKLPEYDTLAIEQHSRQDSMLREEFEERRKYALTPGKGDYHFEEVEELYFFPPVSGIVTNVFEGESFHYGVDIVSVENAPVKAVLDGKVIFSGWTLKYGNVIAIQHIDNLISIYKHNSVLLKKVGNFVEAGDVVALIGNTGEFSEGPHLHFELWHRMVPINPLDYIVFDS
jgi:murein DD-endopeptidase MepM/ murein hydrolase activator NlpD